MVLLLLHHAVGFGRHWCGSCAVLCCSACVASLLLLQILLRWGIQHGVSVLPKSVTPERIRVSWHLLWRVACPPPAGDELAVWKACILHATACLTLPNAKRELVLPGSPPAS